MAISTVPSAPININTLILLSYKRAGLLPVEAKLSGANMTPKLEHGRQLLDEIMNELATEGFIARTMGFYDLPIVAGESAYTLPDTILDVMEDAMFVPPENPDTKHTTGELICKQIDQATWQVLTNKGGASSRPQLYAVFRHAAQVQLKFWPVPDEAAFMRIKTVRLLGGNADGTKTPDLEQHWHSYLIWQLAGTLAFDSSMNEKAAQCFAMAADKRKKCVSYAFEHTPQQAVVVGYGWQC